MRWKWNNFCSLAVESWDGLFLFFFFFPRNGYTLILSISRFKTSNHVKMKLSAKIPLQESLSIEQWGSAVISILTSKTSRLFTTPSSLAENLALGANLSFFHAKLFSCSGGAGRKNYSFSWTRAAENSPRSREIVGREKSRVQKDFTTSFRVRFLCASANPALCAL